MARGQDADDELGDHALIDVEELHVVTWRLRWKDPVYHRSDIPETVSDMHANVSNYDIFREVLQAVPSTHRAEEVSQPSRFGAMHSAAPTSSDAAAAPSSSESAAPSSDVAAEPSFSDDAAALSAASPATAVASAGGKAEEEEKAKIEEAERATAKRAATEKMAAAETAAAETAAAAERAAAEKAAAEKAAAEAKADWRRRLAAEAKADSERQAEAAAASACGAPVGIKDSSAAASEVTPPQKCAGTVAARFSQTNKARKLPQYERRSSRELPDRTESPFPDRKESPFLRSGGRRLKVPQLAIPECTSASLAEDSDRELDSGEATTSRPGRLTGRPAIGRSRPADAQSPAASDSSLLEDIVKMGFDREQATAAVAGAGSLNEALARVVDASPPNVDIVRFHRPTRSIKIGVGFEQDCIHEANSRNPTVVSIIAPDSIAMNAGLYVGDTILSINGEMKSPSDPYPPTPLPSSMVR